MAATVFIAVLGGGGVAFLIRFFIALCQDRRGEACRVVHIVRLVETQDTGAPKMSMERELSYDRSAPSPVQHQSARIPQGLRNVLYDFQAGNEQG